MAIKFLTIPSKTLASSITSSASSLQLSDIQGWDGTDLVAGDFGDTIYAVLRNSTNSVMELIELDESTIASASITIVRRGLEFDGDLTTEVSANKRSWVKGDTIVDIGAATPQVFQWLKERIDNAAIAGGIDAETGVKGVTKLSTAPAVSTNPIAVGDNDPRVPTQDENDAMAGGGSLGTPSTTNKFLTEEGVGATVAAFGDGSDGDVEITGTVTLTEDKFYDNLTITGTLITDGYVVYVKNTITGVGTVKHSEPSEGVGGNGGAATGAGGGSGTSGGGVIIFANIWAGTFTIESIGSDGGDGGTGGTGTGSGGAAGAARGAGTFAGEPGKAGAAGVTGTAVGNNGTAGDAANPSLVGNGAAGGAGGSTNTDGVSGGSGGSGGAATAPTVGITFYRFLATSLYGIKSDGTLAKLSPLAGSGSGGSGGNDSSPNQEAGGGGGAGGNGGFILVIYKEKTWTGSTDVSGGTGGTGATGNGSSTAANGSNGNAGVVVELNWNELL